MKHSDNCNCSDLKDFEFTGELPIAERKVIVEDFPAEQCSDCGSVYYDGSLLMKLEKDFLNNKSDIQSKYSFIKSINKIE